MKEMHIKTDHGNVYYWISSIRPDRPTLFFLHGLTADHTMFGFQAAYFKKTCNVISWDAPAHGRSRPYPAFSYADAARALHRILQEAKISHVVLIGQSMGGFIAQSFLCRYPRMVRGFIAIDSCPFWEHYPKSDLWWLRQIGWMSRLFPERLLRSSMARQNAVSDIGRRNMAKMLSQYPKDELCRLLKIGYAGFLEDNRALEIPCPALLLVGEKDRTGKVRTYNRQWAARTGIPLITIPNAAHNANVDAPETVNRCIRDFIGGLYEI